MPSFINGPTTALRYLTDFFDSSIHGVLAYFAMMSLAENENPTSHWMKVLFGFLALIPAGGAAARGLYSHSTLARQKLLDDLRKDITKTEPNALNATPPSLIHRIVHLISAIPYQLINPKVLLVGSVLPHKIISELGRVAGSKSEEARGLILRLTFLLTQALESGVLSLALAKWCLGVLEEKADDPDLSFIGKVILPPLTEFLAQDEIQKIVVPTVISILALMVTTLALKQEGFQFLRVPNKSEESGDEESQTDKKEEPQPRGIESYLGQIERTGAYPSATARSSATTIGGRKVDEGEEGQALLSKPSPNGRPTTYTDIMRAIYRSILAPLSDEDTRKKLFWKPFPFNVGIKKEVIFRAHSTPRNLSGTFE